MKRIFGPLISLALSCSAATILNAQPDLDITSAKKASVEDDVLYVSAGYPTNNHEGLQGQLQALWDKAGADLRTDSYNQPWREASIVDLEQLFGPMDMLYLAVFKDQARVHEVRSAYIWQWGCDEASLIPVLDIGPHKFTEPPWDWGVDAFGITSYLGEAEIRPADPTLIPEDFYNPVSSPVGWELWVDGKKRFTYLDRNQDHDVAPQHILINHTSGERRTIIEKSPLDIRC